MIFQQICLIFQWQTENFIFFHSLLPNYKYFTWGETLYLIPHPESTKTGEERPQGCLAVPNWQHLLALNEASAEPFAQVAIHLATLTISPTDCLCKLSGLF